MAFIVKQVTACCKKCGTQAPISNWNYCENCEKRYCKLRFSRGKLLEIDDYSSGEPREVEFHTDKQVIEFLVSELSKEIGQKQAIREVVSSFQKSLHGLKELRIQ